MEKYHQVGETHGIVLKKDGQFIQVRIIRSAEKDFYHIITEDLSPPMPAYTYQMMNIVELIAFYGKENLNDIL